MLMVDSCPLFPAQTDQTKLLSFPYTSSSGIPSHLNLQPPLSTAIPCSGMMLTQLRPSPTGQPLHVHHLGQLLSLKITSSINIYTVAASCKLVSTPPSSPPGWSRDGGEKEAELGINALPDVTTTWFDQLDSGRPIACPTTPAHLQMRNNTTSRLGHVAGSPHCQYSETRQASSLRLFHQIIPTEWVECPG
ncbi:hypothetical protein An02g05710 [Aspergillus niger]|uniref:Uncharacterized protein n=2 Tax=Aspergillus niger TaxID=5061 RepID=A2QD37_ASPNC|nr:hypothetical protein An02g05710 [Aspergillus niger]CAK47699.1 hypothetical protein An02g05710 [Aspergillus niger]